MIPENELDAIHIAIDKKIATMTCPMCQGKKFSLVKGYLVNLLSQSTVDFGNFGKAIPTAPFTCDNCGFLAQYSMRSLGLRE